MPKFRKITYCLFLLIFTYGCYNNNETSLDEINKNAIRDIFNALEKNTDYQISYNNKIWKEYSKQFYKIGAIETKNDYEEIKIFIEKYPNFKPAKLNKLYYYAHSENGSDKEFENYIKNLNPNDSLKSIINVIKAFRNKDNYFESISLINSAIEKFPNIQSFYYIKTIIEPDYKKKFLIYDEALKKDSLKLLSLYCLDATYVKNYKKNITLLFYIENKTISKEEYFHYLSLRAESYEKLNDLINAEKDLIKYHSSKPNFGANELIGFYKRNNYSKTQILEKIKDLIKNHNYKLEYFEDYKDDKELLKMLKKME